jgi:cytochrome P450
LAPKGWYGRERLFDSFKNYYDNKHHLDGSPLVKARFEINQKHGISIEDIAHFDLSVCIALLVNTVPATFWCLYYLYSRAPLLKEVRLGINTFVKTTRDTSGTVLCSVDVYDVLRNYPLLTAVVQETLRVLSTNASGRVLLKDTVIDGKYLLKKDAMLLLPSAELHNNSDIWGLDVGEFNPDRWLENRDKVPASAYRAFGGGSSLCPGRYLSMNEIMVVLVVMIMKYNLSPVEGEWKALKTGSHITTSVLTPLEDIEVDISDRDTSIEWSFLWKNTEIEQ